MCEEITVGCLSRYDMSSHTYRQLQRDHIRFEEEYAERFSNSFIVRILINYMCYAQENLPERFEAEAVKRLTSDTKDGYLKDDRMSFTKTLTEKFQEFEFINNKNFKKRIMINFILEQFTMLPLYEREKVYCYQQYKTIIETIEKNELLLVTQLSGKEFEVKPYRIAIDENILSYYLIGYSKPKSMYADFGSYSFKLSRIKKCRSCHREAKITASEVNTIKKLMDKFGSAYIINNLLEHQIKNTVVRLTQNGYEYKYLKAIAYQRPIPVMRPERLEINGSVFYDLTFDCSHQQLKNYFFSFGEDAEVLYPQMLRDIFVDEFQASIDRYKKEK